ncbi:hypothetical protein X566_11220 [Afipia sp. P52-10]|nr:hypothetical protein X566_11220 [Afipia sp. P52-10]
MRCWSALDWLTAVSEALREKSIAHAAFATHAAHMVYSGPAGVAA